VPTPGEVDRNDERRRDRRPAKEADKSKRDISISQLCTSVAYHYGLTPKEVAEFSVPQLILWYKTAVAEIGSDKNLDLEISVVPHAKDPSQALDQMRRMLTGKER